MYFYEYTQNNSGGHMVNDKQVTHRLFIEALDAEHADSIAEKKGVYFNGVDEGMDCSCCGDRWYHGRELAFPLRWDKDHLVPSVEAYAELLLGNYSYFGKGEVETRVYYADGSIKEYLAK